MKIGDNINRAKGNAPFRAFKKLDMEAVPAESFISSDTSRGSAAADSLGSLAKSFFSKDAAVATKQLKAVKSAISSLKSKNDKKWDIHFINNDGTLDGNAAFDKQNGTFCTGLGNSANQFLAAFDTDGHIKWAFTEESFLGRPVLDKQGNVYIRTKKNLHKLNKDGEKQWTVPVPEGSSEDMPPVAGKDGMVFFISPVQGKHQTLTAITGVNRNGEVKWNKVIDDMPFSRFQMVTGDDGYVYCTGKRNLIFNLIKSIFNGVGEDQFVLMKLKPESGKVKQSFKMDMSPSEIANGLTTGPNGDIFLVHDRSQSVTRLDKNLSPRWTYTLKKDMDGKVNNYFNSGPSFDDEGNLYLGTKKNGKSTGGLMRINGDGTQEWDTRISDGVKGVPHVTGYGKVFVDCNDGKKRCFIASKGYKSGSLYPFPGGDLSRLPDDVEGHVRLDTEREVVFFKPNPENVLKKLRRRVAENTAQKTAPKNAPDCPDKEADPADDMEITDMGNSVNIAGVVLEKNDVG